MLKNLVLSGGAIKGFSFIGVLRFLEENKVIEYFETFVGSSAGSLICFLVCMGFSTYLIESHCLKILHLYLKEPIDLNFILSLNETLGVDDGIIISNYLADLCFERFGMRDISFLEFSKKTGYNFVVCASNLSTREPKYFCVDATPHVNVLDAIRASITIPFVFTPKIIDHEIYVDAGIFNNFPVDFIENFVLKDTLGVIIKSKPYCPPKPLNLLSYFRLMIDSMLDRINIKEVFMNKIHVVEVDGRDEEIMDFDFNTMKLNVDVDKVKKYIKTGYESIDHSDVKKSFTKGYLTPHNHPNSALENIDQDGNKNIKKEIELEKNLKDRDFSWVQSSVLLPSHSYQLNSKLWDIFDVGSKIDELN